MLVRRIARPMLASIFIAGGLDEIMNPAGKQDVAEAVVTPLFGQSVNTATVVQIDGAVKVVAGTTLALGRFPRLSALALAGSLVPTTAAAHRFWEFQDPQERQLQQVQFFKNVSLLGGLLLASVDTEGKPSVGWRARRAARKLSDQIAGTPSATAAIGETAGNVVESLEAAADRARDAFPSEAVGSAAVQVVDSLESVGDRAREAFPKDAVSDAAQTLVGRVEAAGSRADRRALKKSAKKSAKKARKQWQEAASTSVTAVEDVADRARDAFPSDAIDDALQAVSDKIDSAVGRRDRRRAKKAAKQLRKDVRAAAKSARETVENAADSARSSVNEVAQDVRSRVSA